MNDFSNLSDDDQGNDSDDWNEMEQTGEQTTCLFCTSQFRTIAVALDHCRTEHDFNLLKLKTKFNMDCYSFIKMVNYIRRNKPDPVSLQNTDVPLWSDEAFLKPVATETWLMYDFEDLGSTPSTPSNVENKCSLPLRKSPDLQGVIVNLSTQLQDAEDQLKRAIKDMDKMKQVTKNLIDDKGGEGDDTVIMQNCVSHIKLENDQGYFSTYAHFGIHHEMLSDRVRTESYKAAILMNPAQIKNKVVLDLGCGTGILSMFSAKAGAEKVWSIDQSEIVYRAMDIIRENHLEDKIHLVRGRLEDGEVPFDRVDIIVSEWMGYFLLFEGMLDSVIYAREKHLAPGGLLLPNRCNISIVGSGDVENHKKYIGFWDDVYGFKMSCMVKDVIQEASMDIVPQDQIITSAAILTEIDLYTCSTNAVDFTSTFNLIALKDGQLTALVGYFDTFFDLMNPVKFSTGPHETPTHWKQTVFYLREPITIKEGEVLSGSLVCRRHIKDVRGLKITIRLVDKIYNYTLD